MRISLAHDYFLQSGGAERVANAWLTHYSTSTMHTMAMHAPATFATLDESRVASTLRGEFWANHLHKALPLLPTIASQVKVDDGEVALASTSGWAHHFNYSVPTVAYVHSPARWLYAADDYKLGLTRAPKLGLKASSAYLVRRDQLAMRRMRGLISNSKVTQERIWKAYGRDSEVVPPPVSPLPGPASRPSEAIPDNYFLIVARNRGYKQISAAANVARKANSTLVVVGTGTQSVSNNRDGIYGLGRVSDSELKWLYQNARLLLATGREDFGLTVLEANAEGTPVVAIPAGGYLETVRPGVNGFLAESSDFDSFGSAIVDALSVNRESCTAWSAGFSLTHHIKNIESVIAHVIS